MLSPNNHKTTKRIVYILLSMFIIAIIISVGYLFKDEWMNQDNSDQTVANDDPSELTNNSSGENENNEDPKPEPEPEPETFTDIRIAAAGDIMFHMGQIQGGYNAQTGTYDFTSVFADVKPYFTGADLAIANYETTAGGADLGFSGYPMFNSPDETIDALKDAGIDVLTTVNNHSLDTGSKGLKRTVRKIREKGLISIGTYDEKPDSRVEMIDVKGINVAVIAYTESTNGLGSQFPDEELHAMMNVMEEEIIIEDIREAKELGADLIISFMHWGTEYAPEPNETQVAYAEMMTREGVDIILGSHPHVIQKSEFLEVDGNESFVIYSMGNFVSNQRQETLGSGFEPTEDGIIVQLDIRQNDQTKETFLQNVEYVPTWVYRNKENGQSTFTYRILPVEDFLDSGEISSSFKDRMKRSLDSTVSKMVTTPVNED